MRILIFTPIWKRPEILKEWVRSLRRLPKYELLVVISPEDPYHKEIWRILPGYARFIKHKNTPFGAKKNAGIEAARQLNWDYLMELNSDSIVNPKLFDLYQPFMEKKVPFFGLNNLFATDYKTKKSLFLENYNTDMTFGSGRMLHRDALLPEKLWTDELNDGMDTNMMSRLRKVGVNETVVDCGEVPMIVDLKTETTIWHFKLLATRAKKEVTYDFLKEHIGYDFISK